MLCRVCGQSREVNEFRVRSGKPMIWAYLSEHPCVDCGSSDPRVLGFDHVRGEKHHNVADMKQLRFSWDRILMEIEECEVRCANCHRIRSYQQFNWFIGDEAS